MAGDYEEISTVERIVACKQQFRSGGLARLVKHARVENQLVIVGALLPKNVAAFVPEERLRLLAANDGESLKVSEKSVVFERTTSERAGKLEGDVAA